MHPDGSFFDSARDYTNVLLALRCSSYLVSSSKESSSLSSSPSLGKSSCDFLEAKKSGNVKKREELLSNINHELVCMPTELNICLSSSSLSFSS